MSLDLNILLIFVFLAIGSASSDAELALVSLCGPQIEQMEQGDAHGAKIAKIARDSNTFLSTAQIGVALCGLLPTSPRASSISPYLIPVAESWGMSTDIAGGLVNIVLILIISYRSIVISEMVPKRVAMQCTEQVMRVVVPAVDALAMICRLIIWLIGKNANGIMRVLGLDSQQIESEVSGDELRVLVSPSTNLSKDECVILDDVSDASRIIAAGVMRPRADTVSTEASQSLAEAVVFVCDQSYSRYPVTSKGSDGVIGFVYVRGLLDVRDLKAEIARDVVHEGISLPDTFKLLPSLELPRERGIHLAVVIDEYGDTGGIVMLENMTEELADDIRDEYDLPSGEGDERTTHTVSINGATTTEANMVIGDLIDLTGTELEDSSYKTVIGHSLSKIGKMGVVGDVLHSGDGYSMVITKVDGRRVKTIEVRKAGAPDRASLPAESQSDGANQPYDIYRLLVRPGV